MHYCKLQCTYNLLKESWSDCSIRNGMPVCGMYASYISIDIMHASYYGASVYDYAIL